jgi:hypothetical protein
MEVKVDPSKGKIEIFSERLKKDIEKKFWPN